MTEELLVTQEMRDVIGVESEPVTYDVEKGAIVKFAQAIADSNPIFNIEEAARKTRYGGLIAPPTFLRSMVPVPVVKTPNPYQARLDGGSEWEYFEPVRPGDKITVITEIADIFKRQGRLGDMLFVITKIRYVNQFGRLAVLQRNTMINYNPPERGSRD